MGSGTKGYQAYHQQSAETCFRLITDRNYTEIEFIYSYV
jgi:hypothetical protein